MFPQCFPPSKHCFQGQFWFQDANYAYATRQGILTKIRVGMRALAKFCECEQANTHLRAQLYGLGYPRQPSPRATLAEVTFSLFLSKIQPAVYIRIANSSRGARQLGWANCLTSAGRVTLVSGTTFLHINALARLTGTSLGVANVT